MKRVPESNPILAWHFCALDPQRGPVLASYDGTEPLTVAPGYVYTTDELRIVPCESGLHGSRDPFDALMFAPGPVLCRTAHWGAVVEGRDKLASRHREVIWCRDVSRELRLFACWCVRQVWPLVTDARSRRAVEVTERFARGEAPREELAAAWGAAWDAAWDAARGAAWDAARAAAWGAAWGAAWDAAGGVARGAAWDAAWGAAWDAQRAEWNRVCASMGEDQ